MSLSLISLINISVNSVFLVERGFCFSRGSFESPKIAGCAVSFEKNPIFKVNFQKRYRLVILRQYPNPQSSSCGHLFFFLTQNFSTLPASLSFRNSRQIAQWL